MAEPHIVFGGTFDPVHDGHLAVARTVHRLFRSTVHLMPAGEPPHRAGPRAPAVHRLAMLALATGDEPGLAIDPRETRRSGPSWTIDTVEELRRELPAARPLLLVIGMDSLRRFTTWRRWRDILGNAHLVACSRPGEPQPDASDLGESGRLLVDDPLDLLESPGGSILIERTTAANIASTRIRAALMAGERPEGVLPAVLDYIDRHHLYRPPPGVNRP